MVLEATMIIVDNSESSRNGDYIPTRWEAQVDAVNMLFTAKTQANPESSVGLASMGGQGGEVLVTLTSEFGKILDGLHRTSIKGHAHLSIAIQVAALALKHRQNKAQRQRIIVFSCSQTRESEKELVQLAKKMRKLNVSIDIIAFGDLESETTKKLTAFNENVRGGEPSHLEIVQPGPILLSDHLLSTPILAGEGVPQRSTASGADGMTNGSGGGFEFGVDPDADPELALALRMSMEEEKARQEKEKPKADASEPTLEGIAEEANESQPLLAGDGEGSGAVDAPVARSNEDQAKDKGNDGDDTMDTS